jgi:hypothetical protein
VPHDGCCSGVPGSLSASTGWCRGQAPMSGPTTAEGWVLKLARDRPDLSSTELHLLLVLAARHNRDYNIAHPKIELLHRETHISTRQIKRLLNGLGDPRRPAGQILHISFGPLPMVSKGGNPVYGNVYRFVGFDPIPEGAHPRRRDFVDTRPKAGDTMSHSPGDIMSHGAGDTGDAGNVTPGGGAGDTGDAGNVTPANSPLYPVGNPALLRRDRNPDLNPARLAAQTAPIGARPTTNVSPSIGYLNCRRCGDFKLVNADELCGKCVAALSATRTEHREGVG